MTTTENHRTEIQPTQRAIDAATLVKHDQRVYQTHEDEIHGAAQIIQRALDSAIQPDSRALEALQEAIVFFDEFYTRPHLSFLERLVILQMRRLIPETIRRSENLLDRADALRDKMALILAEQKHHENA